MRYIPQAATSDWRLLEVAKGDTCVVSGRFQRNWDQDTEDVYRALTLLRAAGCPPDKLKGNPEVQLWKDRCPGAHAKTAFWCLKAKPGRWRLYFIADSQARTLTFLEAVEKKNDKRNPKDFDRLCRILAQLQRGQRTIRDLAIPSRP